MGRDRRVLFGPGVVISENVRCLQGVIYVFDSLELKARIDKRFVTKLALGRTPLEIRTPHEMN